MPPMDEFSVFAVCLLPRHELTPQKQEAKHLTLEKGALCGQKVVKLVKI